MLVGKQLEKDLKFVLPELFLSSLVQEREITNMVDKDVTQNGQFRIFRGNFTLRRAKGSAEALQSSRRGKVCNLKANLP